MLESKFVESKLPVRTLSIHGSRKTPWTVFDAWAELKIFVFDKDTQEGLVISFPINICLF